MKKIRVLIVAMLMLLGTCTVAIAADNVKIKVNGVGLSDAQAILKDGTTLLPVRSVGNALGGNVTWDNTTKTVIVEKDGTTVVAPVGEKFMLIDDETKAVSIPPQIIDGKTYIPLRVIGEALSCEITWVNETKTVEINSARKDLFGDDKKEEAIEFPIVQDVYLAKGDDIIVPFPTYINTSTIETSGTPSIEWCWTEYAGENAVEVIAVKTGISELRLNYKNFCHTIIKFNVVDESTNVYQAQKAERIAKGLDLTAIHQDFISIENKVKEKYGMELMGFNEKYYVAEDGVLIIPIKSNTELTGEIKLSVLNQIDASGWYSPAEIEAVMDYYMGYPAVFIKGIQSGSTNAVLRYINNSDNELKFVFDDDIPDMNFYLERKEMASDPELSKLETAAWEFEISVSKENFTLYQKQEKERVAKGISYDLYLSGLV